MNLPPPKVLSVERLAKAFGKLQAVDGVSFSVAPGEIVGLLGPNGAGKTTTINMILGVLEPTAGRIAIEGSTSGPTAAPRSPEPISPRSTRRCRAT